MHSISGASIHEIEGCGCRFGPIEIQHVILMQHGPCYLEYMSILPSDYILLGCMLA
mgnify:FL=1